jgi:7-keto-8-aminopelargonate synthetase-like enzyme
MAGFFDPFEEWAADRVVEPSGQVEGVHAGELEWNGRRVLNAASHDVLGLGTDARVREAALAAIRRYGSAAPGLTRVHRELAERLAQTLNKPAVVLSSSFERLLLPLFEAADSLRLESRSLESLQLVARLAHAQPVGSLDEEVEHPLVVAPGVAPHEGDLGEISKLDAFARRNSGALLVDESYSFGVLGTNGLGASEHLLVDAPLVGGTLQGLASQGAFLAGPKPVVEYLAAALGTQAMPAVPACAAAAKALEIATAEPNRRARLWDATAKLKQMLHVAGFDTGPSVSHRIPLWVGDEGKAMRLARELLDAGVRVGVHTPPSRARLMVNVQSVHTDAQLEQIAALLEKHARSLGVIEGARPASPPPSHLARPGSYLTTAPTSPRWSVVQKPPEEPQGLRQLLRMPSKAVMNQLFDTVETLTWRAAQLGSTDLKRIWEKRKRLRDLLPR